MDCSTADPHNVSQAGHGVIAQLGERLHGMQEVDGSIPSGSTTILHPFTDVQDGNAYCKISISTAEACREAELEFLTSELSMADVQHSAGNAF